MTIIYFFVIVLLLEYYLTNQKVYENVILLYFSKSIFSWDIYSFC